MKVLFVCSGNSKYGIVPFVKSQGESLKKIGVDLDYFTIKGKGITGYLKIIKILKRHIKENNYDLIHSHYVYSSWIAILSIPRIPIIISFMGEDLYGSVNSDGKRTFRSYLSILLSQLIQPFVNFIIVKSANLEKYVHLKKKMHIIPNGVDLELFKDFDKVMCRKKLNLLKNKKLILFLGNPSDPRKNIMLLKRAMRFIDKSTCAIVTPFPIRPENVVYYLNAADVLAQTSYLEGSPNVIKEAMACNCPIVSTDVGDVKEIIGNTKGCFITSYDSKDIAKKIQLALNLNKRTNGRENILHLDINIIAKRIIQIYQRVLKKKK